MFHPTLKIKIYQEDLVFGPGLVILMEHILVTESMKDACGEMGMSYSKGWKIINRAEKELGYELLERTACRRALKSIFRNIKGFGRFSFHSEV